MTAALGPEVMRMAPNPESAWGPYHHREHDMMPSCSNKPPEGGRRDGPACMTVEQRASLDRGMADGEAGRSRSRGSFANTVIDGVPAYRHDGWARDVIDSLPPKTWDVSIRRHDAQGFIMGRLDLDDVQRLVTAVLDVVMETKLPDVGGRAVPGVYREEQGR